MAFLDMTRAKRTTSQIRAALERGESIEDAAIFLCRRGTIAEVPRKAQEIGLVDAEPMPKVRAR